MEMVEDGCDVAGVPRRAPAFAQALGSIVSMTGPFLSRAKLVNKGQVTWKGREMDNPSPSYSRIHLMIAL